MEPQLPKPESSPEVSPKLQPERTYQTSGEVMPSASPERPMIAPETKGSEQVSSSQGGGDPGWQAPQLPAMPPSTTTAPKKALGSTAVLADSPLLAKDDDLIEQEWVNKAKKIVISTKDDPFMKEREVSKLQADYLQKRYGKELKLSSE